MPPFFFGVVQWLALSLHDKAVLGLNPLAGRGSSVWSLHVLAASSQTSRLVGDLHVGVSGCLSVLL